VLKCERTIIKTHNDITFLCVDFTTFDYVRLRHDAKEKMRK
jgi:hypothetical protein